MPGSQNIAENIAQGIRQEILDNGTAVLTAPHATFGTDALLLARFAAPKPREAALDLCSGCGIIALAWHDAGHRGPCTAVELDPAASALCAAAVAQNGAAHIAPLCADLRQFCFGAAQGRYSFAACNPPYFGQGQGPASPAAPRATARHDAFCTLADMAACAARALHDGGRFAVCQRPERLNEVFAALTAAHLEPKRLAFAKNAATGKPWLFLVEAQKNRRPGLVVLPDIITGSGVHYGAGVQGLAAKG